MKANNTDPLYEWFADAYPQEVQSPGHGQRFQQKLAAERQAKRQRASFRVAAMVLVLFGLTAALVDYSSNTSEEMERFYQTEAYFQSLIQNQLEKVPMANTSYQVPITAAKTQLLRLQETYQMQTQQFQNGTDHPKLLRAMINNLQKQLEILQDLERNIETINSQSNDTELL
ncbi:MAG: hypothetical protein ACON47_07095 [Flavobacteriaceae bacterium]